MTRSDTVDEAFVRAICKDPIWKTAQIDVDQEALDEFTMAMQGRTGAGTGARTGGPRRFSGTAPIPASRRSGKRRRTPPPLPLKTKEGGTTPEKKEGSVSKVIKKSAGWARKKLASAGTGLKSGLLGQSPEEAKKSRSMSKRAGAMVGRGIRAGFGGLRKRAGAAIRGLVTGEMTETEARAALYEIFDEHMVETVSEETVMEMVDMLFEPLVESTIAEMVEEGTLELEDEE